MKVIHFFHWKLSNYDWCICQKSALNLQEAVFLVEEVEQEPAEGEVAEAEDEFGPRLGEKTHDAAEEEIRHWVKTQDGLPQVNGDRVHADNLEE